MPPSPSDDEGPLISPSRPTMQEPGEEIGRWLQNPPWWGKFFDKAAQITLAGNAGLTEITAFRIQAGYLGLLRWFTNVVGSSSDAPFISYSLLLDGMPVSGYFNMIGPKSGGLTDPEPIMVPLFAGQRISVVASNSAGSSIQNVGARIKGWIWTPHQPPSV